MLRDFFVIETNGLGIFEWHEKRHKTQIDMQLLSGFVSALMQFSSTALMDNMQTLELEKELMVITFLKDTPTRYAVGIYDKIDDERPARRLNKKIIRAFNSFSPYHEDNYSSVVEGFPLEQYLHQKPLPIIIPHSLSMAVILILLSCLGVYAILEYIPFIHTLYLQAIKSGFTDNTYYYLLVFGFAIPYIITGFFSGSWSRGLWIGLISVSVLESLLFITLYFEGLSFIFIIFDLMAGFGTFFSITGGYLGGLYFLSSKQKRNELKPAI